MGDSEAARPCPGEPLTPARERHAAELAAILVALAERAALHPSDLPRSTIRALGAVQEGAQVSLGELSGSLGIAPATASRLCGRLEDAGLLVRRPDPADRRRLVLELTPRGEARLRTYRAQHLRHIATLLRLPDVDLAAFAQALAALREGLLERLGAAESPCPPAARRLAAPPPRAGQERRRRRS
ncbi:MarR family winged helix-turn-helix transcriptional regulator [Streptomyces lavendofoliae]|uniref:MarR family winged helix-turn-helix transcriptional regulator n=1 Tax=Streptomyces lavendofoliae TaxID=67314 RepID=UPI003AEFEF8E